MQQLLFADHHIIGPTIAKKKKKNQKIDLSRYTNIAATRMAYTVPLTNNDVPILTTLQRDQQRSAETNNVVCNKQRL